MKDSKNFWRINRLDASGRYFSESSDFYGPLVECPIDNMHRHADVKFEPSRFSQYSDRWWRADRKNKRRSIYVYIFGMLLHDEIFRVLESEELTGWTRIPAQLQFRDGSISDEYAELHIAGFGGIVPETSGNKLLWRCRGCGVREYAGTLRGAEIEKIIDWDGSDFFKVWPAMAMSFCTDRARGVLERCAPELEFSPMSAQADVTSYGDGNIPPYHPDNVRRKIEAYWAAAPVWPDDFPNTPSKPDVASPPAG